MSVRVLAALSRGSVIPALPLLTELQLASLNIFPIGKANRKAAERERHTEKRVPLPTLLHINRQDAPEEAPIANAIQGTESRQAV